MHPVFFTFGPISVATFGLLLALGIGAAVVVTGRLSERAGLDRALGADALFACCIVALVFSRVTYVVASPQVESLRTVLALGSGGLSGYGALFGAALGASVVLSRRGAPLLPWFDAAVPGVLLAVALGRLGCYLEGCDFGVPLTAVAPPWLKRLGSFPQHGSVHPTQLYEGAGALALAVLSAAARSAQRAHGQLLLGAVLGYAALRFSVEGWRGDGDRGLLPWFSVNSAFALATALGALGAAAWRPFQRLRST